MRIKGQMLKLVEIKTGLRSFARKYSAQTGLGLLVLFLFCAHFYWNAHNDLLCDEVNREHVPRAMFFYKHMAVSPADFFRAYGSIDGTNSCWPVVRSPLVYLVTGAVNLLSGFSVFKVQAAFFIFFLVLILSVYRMTVKLADKNTALLACVFTAFNPLVFYYSHIYNQDLPLAAMCALAFYFLLEYGEFKNLRESVILGAVFGLGVLTKPTFVLYLSVPLIFALKNAAASGVKEKVFVREKIRAVFVFFLSFFLVSALWFANKISHIVPTLQYEFFVQKFQQGVKAQMLFYPVELLNRGGWLSAAAFFLGVPGFPAYKSRYKRLFLSWMFGAFFVLMLISNKQIRFVLPVIPAAAVFSAIGISAIKNLKFKKIVVTALTLLLACQFFYLSFFFRFAEFPFAGVCRFFCADLNRPPIFYWASRCGEKYPIFFRRMMRGLNREEEPEERLAAYLACSRFVFISSLDQAEAGGLSFNDIFKQYLLFFRPGLLMKLLPDEELFTFFVSLPGDENSALKKEDIASLLKLEKLRGLGVSFRIVLPEGQK